MSPRATERTRPAGSRAAPVPARAASSASEPPSEGTIREIYRRLERRFGPLDPPPRREPVEELVLTVLSQNTSDVNRDRAFAALRRSFPTWEELAAAEPREVAEAIRPGGLSNVKAPRILAILKSILDRDGSLDLAWMHAAPAEKVSGYLTSLSGVGPKTAACVLAFSLGRPALPVDTHVNRVARRLGFYGEGVGPTQAHRIMEERVPARLRVRMHVGMIRLGRAICRPGRPACEVCPLQDICPTAPVVLAAIPG